MESAIRVMEPSRGWIPLNLSEVWRYRDLLFLLVWRNTIVKYKQSLVGVGWAVVKPVVSMVVFTVVFGQFANLPSDGIPYPIFTYVALLPWLYFANCLGGASGSLLSGMGLADKVYFPRLILPLSNLFSGLVDFCISFVVLVGMMVWYRGHITVGWPVLCLPLFLLLAMATAFASGLWLTTFSVRYRDVIHLMPFLAQIWMYLTPVAYSASLVPPRWRLLYSLNPMTGVVDGFRWSLLGRSPPDWTMLAVTTAIVIVLMVGGLYQFRRTETTFVDIA